MCIWEEKGWPVFIWDEGRVAKLLATIRLEQGRLIGRMEALGFEVRQEATLTTLTEEIRKSAKIEGEELNENEVRSSIARRLGMNIAGLTPSPRHVDGFVEMMIDATGRSNEELTLDRLFGWHAALFPAGRSGMRKIIVGGFRDDSAGPMTVVSGALGKEKIHFEAPPAKRLKNEADDFLEWFKDNDEIDLVLQSGLAHLWFLTLHPFDDGNGRIARAISDFLLTRSEGGVQRYYSISSQIERERKDYYLKLESAQKGGLDITNWLIWYFECLGRAISNAHVILADVLKKSNFWKQFGSLVFNERQNKILNMLLDGFEGKLTTSKYAKINKCSQDTAYRDILDLVEHDALVKDAAGGRSTSYSLNHKS